MSTGPSAETVPDPRLEDAAERSSDMIAPEQQSAVANPSEVPAAPDAAVTTSANDSPTADAPAGGVSVAEAPSGDETAADVPAADVPATDVASGDVPGTGVPAAEAPAADASTTDAPAADATANPDAPAADATANPDAAHPSRGDDQARRAARTDGQRRRRRPNAAERHRRVFFAKLSELRRADQGPDTGIEHTQVVTAAATGETGAPQPAQGEGAASSGVVVGATADVATSPVEGQAVPVIDAPVSDPVGEASQSVEQAAPANSGSRSQARLAAAVERVGGAPVVLEALTPKHDEQGQQLKWAAVCCQACQGLAPGDPTFAAWLRLAITPVREIKNQVSGRSEGYGRQGGRRDDRNGRSGDRRPRSGGRSDSRGPRPSSGDVAAHGRDGAFKTKVRIIGDLSSITG